ncbi:DUF4912 domain-containing protein [Alicyclobacillus sacchari]|uniref:DUF4912 domain-containing protein n=1 Tax=Alicyclobacillus sacchari TaxID=392010 RepID=UPI0024E0F919|nr:DUF4912 domain-containing protein [Alicyclobacillus sacchari]
MCDWSNMPLSICVYDVTGVWFDGHNAPLVRQEIIQPTDTTNWYIHNLVPGRHYVVDLTLERDGERFSLLRSNMVSLPPLAKHGAQPDLKFASPFVTTVQTAGLRISDIASRQDDKGNSPSRGMRVNSTAIISRADPEGTITKDDKRLSQPCSARSFALCAPCRSR